MRMKGIVFDVSTPAAVLEGGSNNFAVYNDLQTGNKYATRTIQQTEAGKVLDFPLSAVGNCGIQFLEQVSFP